MVHSGPMRWLGRQFGVERLCLGDPRKSWDVLATATFVEDRLPKEAPIVDFGAYRSEIPGVLCRLGYTDLRAVDLNPRVVHGPYPDRVRYTVGDFCATGFAPGSVAAVTAISAIEHGHSVDRVLAEAARLLSPGGYFVGSTDYWPEKVDTTGVRIFDMDWTVFSASEMADLLEGARSHGLEPAGDMDFAAGEPVIEHLGRRYTFAWFALRRRGPA